MYRIREGVKLADFIVGFGGQDNSHIKCAAGTRDAIRGEFSDYNGGQFEESAAELLRAATVVIAYCDEPDYEMSAEVVLLSGCRLYEVEASHCSCYGFEGQFEPAEISLEYLRNILATGAYRLERARAGYREAFATLVDALEEATDAAA